MYAQFFGLQHEPFSIAPDPRYLFMSERHREALAHLLYGLRGGGGFVLLSGEIGAGKTTVCRCFLEKIPKRCNVAYIFNPKLTVEELLKSICDEFRIPVHHDGPGVATIKDYLDPLNEFLLKTHAVGQNNVLIIDEAQNLSADVLEQLRLLTNLETNERKLLQIILIGQPELRTMLARPELEQLAQRVIARFHLEALSERETAQYVRHRLGVAGLTTSMPFDRQARQRIHQLSRGIPRRINLLCDRALLGAYASGRNRVDREVVEKAAREVFGIVEPPPAAPAWAAFGYGRIAALGGLGLVAGAALLGIVSWAMDRGTAPGSAAVANAAPAAAAASAAASAVAASASAVVRPTVAVAVAVAAASAVPVAASAVPAAAGSAPASTFKPQQRDEKEAWRELASLWQLPLAAGEPAPCEAVARRQLQCFRGSGGLALVRQLDRPGILTLRDEQDKPVYVLLTGLTKQSATLRSGGVSHTLPLSSLASVWRGEFATLWRTPPAWARKIADGDSGPAAQWLATRLARFEGQPAPATGQAVMDAAMKARLHTFQLAQGLRPDGVAGPVTLMLLNRATGVEEPQLQVETASN
ncbi:ExeA family protein [Methylibium rhizosphaerae]|uniref:ExeA family protein n=1 Tax=Methylibium rhizosphaerae TaxID=2570323 RepID=UPI00112C2AC2|nr:ExeA family protein [Methylibium rhizosphaerae]